jgi:hypothetical protein
MVTHRKRGRQRRELNNHTLEAYLQASLMPVSPRPEFIDGLRVRLNNAPIPKSTAPVVIQFGILAAAGMISGLILLVAGLRALVTILGTLGLLRHARGQRQEQAAAVQSPL